ncbi:MAG: dihydroxyacetone kinase subunit DhaL [Verrucomicrobiales bacterium]
MAKQQLSVDETVAMLDAVADAIIAAEPELSEADRNLGDGDHGLGMKRGMEAVKAKLSEGSFESVDKVFMAMGMAMMSSMGGASGAVFGTLFRNGGKALKGSETFDAAGLAEFLKGGTEGVMSRGGAKPGDKTMVDALEPAQKAAESAVSLPLSEALDTTAQAAEAGRDASKDLIATMGRAKTLGEASIGHPDAGACSVAIIFRTMATFAAGN